MGEEVNHWIVIVATACSGFRPTLDLNAVTSNIGSSSLSGVYRPIPVDPPQLYVFRAKSRDEAEVFAIGYREIRYSDSVSGMTLTRTPPPLGCAESAVVVSPDGNVYSVKRQPKTKKVMREVEEPDGSEIIWDEKP